MTFLPGVLTLLVVAATGNQTQASAGTDFFVISIGFNGVPEGSQGALQPLRYADDDAVAIANLGLDLDQHAILLTDLDSDTSQRHATSALTPRPPTRAQLVRAISEVNAMARDSERRGRQASLLIYYSGHGQTDSLTLADGLLTQASFFDDILPQVESSSLHLVVDSCNAEMLIRPRDLTAPSVEQSSTDLRTYQRHQTLTGFPRAGAILATSKTRKTHEWDAYRGGVFTHEILSALRGAADVNLDGVVEYSEVAAFLSATNRGVLDDRAKPEANVYPPRERPRAPIVRLSPSSRTATLAGDSSLFGRIAIEDNAGLALLSLHAEPGRTIRLLLPADTDLFLQSRKGEAHFRLSQGETKDFADLRLRSSPDTHSRGAVEESLFNGLNADPFGPGYYTGFVDANRLFRPVSFPASNASGAEASMSSSEPSNRRISSVLWGSALTFAVSSAVTGGFALNARHSYGTAMYQREADEAKSRYETFGLLSIGAISLAVACAIGAQLLSH